MSRSLKITKIARAMATAAFVDVVVDPKLGKLNNRSRNRRVMFLIMLVGAFAQRKVSSTFPILICTIGKARVRGLFNRPMAIKRLKN